MCDSGSDIETASAPAGIELVKITPDATGVILEPQPGDTFGTVYVRLDPDGPFWSIWHGHHWASETDRWLIANKVNQDGIGDFVEGGKLAAIATAVEKLQEHETCQMLP